MKDFKIKGYKGFNKDFTCEGKQYEENTIFEEQEAEMYKSAMYFCENPMDVLDFYGFVNENGEINEFANVEANQVILQRLAVRENVQRLAVQVILHRLAVQTILHRLLQLEKIQ